MLTKEELSKIASLSCLSLSEKEELKFLDDLQKILSYIEQLNSIVETDDILFNGKNMNVFREDKVKPSESESILKYAQKTEISLLVVPVVLRKN